MTLISHNRKRLRSALTSLVCAAAACQEAVMGFTSSPTTSTSAFSLRPRIFHPPSPLQALQRVEFDKPTSNPALQQLPRLSHQEQMALLDQTVELRRIQQAEADLLLHKKQNAQMLSVRCQAAGFGDDWQAYEAAVQAGHAARQTLVTTNMGLVHFCINEIIGKRSGGYNRLQSLSREDLAQEGAIGLARAVDRWNPEVGGKFSTYAVYWIRACVLRCIAERDDLMRVPEHVSTAARKVTKAAKRLGLEIDGEHVVSALASSSTGAIWKEAQAAKALAEEAGLTSKQLTEAMRVKARRRGGILSYEAWMQNGKGYEVDLAPVTEDDSSMASLESEHLRKALSRFLRPREMEALSWRYGLISDMAAVAESNTSRDYLAEAEEHLFGETAAPAKKKIPTKGRWGESMTFDEVGNRMQVSAEYGRRLCHAGLEKLRAAAAEGSLEPQLLY